LGIENPEHVVIELSAKYKSLGIKNLTKKRFGIKNPEHAVVELSDNQVISDINISSADK